MWGPYSIPCLSHSKLRMGANSGVGSSLGRPLPLSPEVSGSPERKKGRKEARESKQKIKGWWKRGAGGGEVAVLIMA